MDGWTLRPQQLTPILLIWNLLIWLLMFNKSITTSEVRQQREAVKLSGHWIFRNHPNVSKLRFTLFHIEFSTQIPSWIQRDNKATLRTQNHKITDQAIMQSLLSIIGSLNSVSWQHREFLSKTLQNREGDFFLAFLLSNDPNILSFPSDGLFFYICLVRQ